MQGCTPAAYCGVIAQNGSLQVQQCFPYPSGCNDCTCATAALGTFYGAHFPGYGFPPCTCSEVSGTLLVNCQGA
jgi:hypothetical protein